MSTLLENRLRLVGALAGLNLLLVVGGWLLLVSPQRQHEHAAAQQFQLVKQEAVLLLGHTGPQVSHAARQPTIHTSTLYRDNTAMPVTADEPDLMLALSQFAKASGVKVLGLSPQAPTAEVGYVVLPVQLSLDGSYGSLTRYFRTLRLLVGTRHGQLIAHGRLLSIVSVAMTPDAKGRTESATVDLDAYVFGPVNGTQPLSTVATSTSTDTTSTTTTTGG